ncbi:unnamed protein product [Anisakis simplex]|uniref:Antibiotic biosynthesis monooxygenase n=1 Tax=Anisakis simplex TaxID=6269 RepID=A0A0M3JIM4_ANISI|nr:unnamed protein product [Anisakis simplex]
MSGIHFAIVSDSDESIQRSEHLKVFYEALANGGLTLNEPEPIEHSYRTDRMLTYDSYPVHHTMEDKTDE